MDKKHFIIQIKIYHFVQYNKDFQLFFLIVSTGLAFAARHESISCTA